MPCLWCDTARGQYYGEFKTIFVARPRTTSVEDNALTSELKRHMRGCTDGVRVYITDVKTVDLHLRTSFATFKYTKMTIDLGVIWSQQNYILMCKYTDNILFIINTRDKHIFITYEEYTRIFSAKRYPGGVEYKFIRARNYNTQNQITETCSIPTKIYPDFSVICGHIIYEYEFYRNTQSPKFYKYNPELLRLLFGETKIFSDKEHYEIKMIQSSMYCITMKHRIGLNVYKYEFRIDAVPSMCCIYKLSNCAFSHI